MKGNIKEIRKSKKIKQKELATMTGLSIGTIINAENHMETCKIETLEKIAKALKINILDLFPNNK